jgi:hypothetical protein
MSGEAFTFYSVSWPHARLQRPCCECGLQIDRGERYQRLSGYCDGSWRNFSTCDSCAKIRDEFFPNEFTMTQLMEELLEMRTNLSYDDVRTWALLTNAIASVRARSKAARTYGGIPPITPSGLRGLRAITGA